MSWLDEARMYARFTRDLRAFLKRRLTLNQARAIVQGRMSRREASFLSLTKRAIYENPRSPYLALLQRAHCDYGALEARVRAVGLGATLRELREAGVYADFEEFKGRVPIIRPGLELPVKAGDFDNPFLKRHLIVETGGSTGAGTRSAQDLSHYAALAPHQMLTRAAHGVLDVPLVIWRGILPDGSGMNNVLQSAYYGHGAVKWFSQLAPFETKHVKYTLASYALVLLGWLNGARLPLPRYAPLGQAVVVARALGELLAAQGRCLVSTVVSRAVRLCLAAREEGIELHGATFYVAGEPLTPAKAQIIRDVGATLYTNYGMEAGCIAHGCARPLDDTDVHVALDAVEVFSRPLTVPGFLTTVPVLNFTTLLPSTPKIMLNLQVDDYATVETRTCGCDLESLGWHVHLRQIRSYRKLTGEGVTLVGSDMVRVLEEVLPRQFGGTALDYQLLEQEDDHSLTRLYLIISPRVPIADERAVLDVVHRSLQETSVAADVARTTWQQADTIQIKRIEPLWSARGKFNPLVFRARNESSV